MNDTFEQDGIKLILGDCLDVLPGLQGVDCVVTSPPYNQLSSLPEKGSGLWGKSAGGAGFLRKWNATSYSDDMLEESYQKWQNDLFSTLFLCCKSTASLFYNHQLRWRDGECLHPIAWFHPTGWKLRSEIIWDRCGGMMFNARMFCRFDERILWFYAGNHKWNQECVGMGTVWKIAREQQQNGKVHPVEYPVDIPLRCISSTTDACDLVIDPFMGSGTTGIACIRTGRRFVGIEKSPEYFKTAVERIKRELAQPMLPSLAPMAMPTQEHLFTT